ncbi:hypothetical protein [Acinetobacter baumannii]|nr:hypothetical protein [Acinetobacter baumannii]
MCSHVRACGDGGGAHVHAGDRGCGHGPEPARGHVHVCAHLEHAYSGGGD